jgi:transcriptional regulator with GAF, ATPase, and Fis domain
LETVIEKLVAFVPDQRISRSLVASVLRDCPANVSSLRQAEQRRQREELVGLLDETGGNLAEVARRLDLSRGAVIYRAQKFGLMPRSSY